MNIGYNEIISVDPISLTKAFHLSLMQIEIFHTFYILIRLCLIFECHFEPWWKPSIQDTYIPRLAESQIICNDVESTGPLL